MKRFIFIIVILFSSIVEADGLIGVAVPLSGDGAWIGENVLKGIKLYCKQNQINFSNRFVVEDVGTAQNQTANGITAVKKLIETDKVEALILTNSQVVNGVAGFIDEREIPSIAIVGAETASGRSHQVRLWARPIDEAEALAGAVKDKKIVIFYSEQDAQLARTKILEQVLVNTKVLLSTVVDSESMNSIVLKAIKLEPDAIIMMLMPGLHGLAAKKLHQYKFGGSLLGSVLINTDSEVKLSEGALNGALFPDVAYTEEFLKQFQAEYDSYPPSGSGAGYDAAKIIIEGQAETLKNTLNEAIHRSDFHGAMGRYGILKDGSNNYKIPVVLNEVK